MIKAKNHNALAKNYWLVMSECVEAGIWTS